MSFPHAWARLPGPADFLDSIVKDLTHRSSVLVGLPDEAPVAVVAVEIADAIKRNGLGRWETVRSKEVDVTSPLAFIARRFDGRDAEDFVLWIDAMNGDATATAWADYARQFAGIEKTPRICIAMSAACAEECSEDKGLRRRLWRDFVTASDARVLMERFGRRFGRSPEHIALKSTLIVELAGPDLAFAERLAREPIGRILAARDHPPECIWAAQVSVLFPLVERERRRLLDVYRGLWRMPHLRDDGKEIQRLEDLEIGDMAAQAWQVRALEIERRRLDWLRRVRNALAHNEIVPWDTLVSPIALQITDFRE